VYSLTCNSTFTNRVMLFRGTNTDYSEDQMKHVSALCGQTPQMLQC